MSFSEECQLSLHIHQYVHQEMDEIDGWLSRDEATMFGVIGETQADQRFWGDLVDLGVWKGRSTLMLQRLMRSGELLVAADIFDLRDASHSHFNDPEEFIRNANKLGALDDRLRVVKLNTLKSLDPLRREVAPESVRIFHVDGGHEYKVVRRDINFALTTLTPEGVLVCDDTFDRKHAGVTQALVEAIQRNRNIVPFAISSRKTWLCSPELAETFKDSLRSAAPKSTRKQVEFMEAMSILVN